MFLKNVSPIFWTVKCVIYRPDWARSCVGSYKNTKMAVSLEVGMLIPSHSARKNSLIVPTSC